MGATPSDSSGVERKLQAASIKSISSHPFDLDDGCALDIGPRADAPSDQPKMDLALTSRGSGACHITVVTTQKYISLPR